MELDKYNIKCIKYEKIERTTQNIMSINYVIKYSDLCESELFTRKDDENQFFAFQQECFSKMFFEEDSDLRWNFYLYVILNSEGDYTPEMSMIEQDDNYIRKMFLTLEEFEIYLNILSNKKSNELQVLNAGDLFGKWQIELGKLFLDGCLTQDFRSEKVRRYVELGEPIRSIGRPTLNNEEELKNQLIVSRLETISLVDFRNFCFQKNTNLSFANINLISGINGSGKSTICSAIEFAMTGEINGNTADGKVIASVDTEENILINLSSEKSTKDKKAFDKSWYGTTTMGRKASLNQNFHVFNYMGLEVTGDYINKDIEIDELIKNILFGTDITESEKRMQRYQDGFNDLKKEYVSRVRELQNEIDNIPKPSITNKKNEMSNNIIKEQFIALGYNEKKRFIDFSDEEYLEQCNVLITTLASSFNSMAQSELKDESVSELLLKKLDIESKIDRVKKITNELKQLEENYNFENNELISLKGKVYELRSKTIELKNIHNAGKELNILDKKKDELEDEYQAYYYLKERQSYIENWLLKYACLFDNQDSDIFNKNDLEKVSLFIQSKQEEEKKITELIDKHKNQKERVNLLNNEINIIINQIVDIESTDKHCPVCGTIFESNKKMKEALLLNKSMNNQLDVIFDEYSKQQIELKNIINEKNNEKVRIEKAVKLAEQRNEALSLLENHIDIDCKQSNRSILDVAKEYEYQLHLKINNSTPVFVYIDKMHNNYCYINYKNNDICWGDFLSEELNKQHFELKSQEKILGDRLDKVDKNKENLDTLKLQKDSITINYAEYQDVTSIINCINSIQNSIDINEKLSIFEMNSIFQNLHNIIKKEYNGYIEYKNNNEFIRNLNSLNEKKMDIQNKLEICNKVLDAFRKLIKLKDITQKFLQENVKQIELFFKLLHRPKEFSNLKIINGEIRFTRTSNELIIGAESMSTGQKMALSISLLLTLHLTAENAPKLIIFDEPVANLDDMHVLNLVDLLRELAMNDTQIILTTANKQIANYLRRKFSFFGDSYYHYELNRKGNTKTQIVRKTYLPNEKEVKKSVIMQ